LEPGSYKEALLNFRAAVLLDHPEEQLSPEDVNLVMGKVGEVFRETPDGGRPLLRSYRLGRGIIFYACADQRSVDWLVTALHGYQIREGARLKAIDAKHLPKPIKMALRTKEKVAKGPEEILEWIKSLNPGLHTENWRVLDSRDEPLGRRLILLVDQDSGKILKGTSYKIYTGLSEGTFKVLSDPEGEIRGRASRGRPQAVDTRTGGKGAGDSTSSGDREKQLGGGSRPRTQIPRRWWLRGLLENLNPSLRGSLCP
jgi:hypothetical protein